MSAAARLFAAVLLLQTTGARDSRPLPDPQPFFEAVRANFGKALEELFDAGAYVGIATHDEWLVDEGRRMVSERRLETSEYEFQMLLGVREDLARRLVADGHRLRIYVPFGQHWYAYSLRRLQENPKIAGYIAADALGRVIPFRNNGR